MNFSDALKRIKLGERLFRKGWNGPNQFVFLVEGSDGTVDRKPLLGIYPRGKEVKYLPYIAIVTVQGTVVPWLASQTDQLAEDWAVVQS